MGEAKPVEIICSACKADTLLMRKPKYDGFTRIGDALLCASCGHEYPREEDVPFKSEEVLRVFTQADKSAKIEVFHDDEKGRLCRYCKSYIVNPFTQWCARHKKEVEATDSCPQFERRPEPPPSTDAEQKPGAAKSIL